jgi:replicative DNA helicase
MGKKVKRELPGRRFWIARNAIGQTQEGICGIPDWDKNVGLVEAKTIRNWEKGNIPQKRLIGIAKCFNVPFYLFSDTDISDEAFQKIVAMRWENPEVDIDELLKQSLFQSTTTPDSRIISPRKNFFEYDPEKEISDYTTFYDIDGGRSEEEIEYYNKTKIKGIRTGYIHFDESINGLMPGNLYVFLGHPSLDFTLNISCNLHRYLDIPTIIINPESELIHTEKLLDSIAGELSYFTEQRKIKTLKDKIKIDKAKKERENLQIQITVIKDVTCMDIERHVTNFLTKTETALVVIENIQLTRHFQKSEDLDKNREAEIGLICRDLKRMAMRLDVPVIAISEFYDEQKSVKTRKPVLSDLLSSPTTRQIEGHADVICFIDKTLEFFQEESLRVDIAKNKEGKSIELHFSYVLHTRRLKNHKYSTYVYDENDEPY